MPLTLACRCLNCPKPHLSLASLLQFPLLPGNFLLFFDPKDTLAGLCRAIRCQQFILEMASFASGAGTACSGLDDGRAKVADSGVLLLVL